MPMNRTCKESAAAATLDNTLANITARKAVRMMRRPIIHAAGAQATLSLIDVGPKGQFDLWAIQRGHVVTPDKTECGCASYG